ncbi:hypothetical protein AB6A40_011237 [Gnathostoma spinigerum]|uniref:Uncharacterized protein n=1 Tax=Gnathostoma spinigerum TaxID=75299 RepID=A0ABD6EXM5_9BILA
MALYVKSISEFENLLKMNIDGIGVDKLEEIRKHREVIKMHLKSTRGRLADLRKLFSPEAKKNATIARIVPRIVQPVGDAPSTSGQRPHRNQGASPAAFYPSKRVCHRVKLITISTVEMYFVRLK